MKIDELEKQGLVDPTNTFYISFSDLMVLLCVFFVMLLGMSKIERGSFEQVKSGITGNTKGTLVELAEQLRHITDKDPGVPGVKVSMAKDGVRLDLETAALFETGKAKLRRNALSPLRPLFKKILGTKYTLDIEGHTDDLGLYKKIGEDLETNWSLSGKRASSVVNP